MATATVTANLAVAVLAVLTWRFLTLGRDLRVFVDFIAVSAITSFVVVAVAAATTKSWPFFRSLHSGRFCGPCSGRSYTKPYLGID